MIKYTIQRIGWGIAGAGFVVFLLLMLADAVLPSTIVGRFARVALEFPILPGLSGRHAFLLGIGWKLILGLYILHKKKLLLGRR